MQALLRKENPTYELEYRTYSDSILGYLVVLDGKFFIFLNEIYGKIIRKKVAYELHYLYYENPQYGFILLYDDFKVRFSEHYQFDNKKNDYDYSDNGNVADFTLVKWYRKVDKLTNKRMNNK